MERKGKVPCLPSENSEVKASFQLGRAPHIIIVTGPPSVPGWDLNPGTLSLEAGILLTKLTRPDK